MSDIGESSSNLALPKSTNEKTVFVRVKRKSYQSRLEAFWLEINERPLKRPLLDFEKLSISDSSGKNQLKTQKVLVRLVETVSSTEATFDILHSFGTNPDKAFESKTKSEERRHTFKKENILDQSLFRARQEQEVLKKKARFEQIWRSRKGNKETLHDKALHDACRLYDVVRVDVEETSNKVHEPEVSLEDHMIMRDYLPLIREFIPSAAVEIESDIDAYMSKQASKDEYVYDVYTVKDDMNITEEYSLNPFPLVQVDDDDDFYDGPAESEYLSDDSNAEDNPRNDYPDEDPDEDGEMSEEEENESGTSDDESEELESECAGDKSPGREDLVCHDSSDDEDLLYGDEICSDEDDSSDGYEYDRW